jgi:septal ring factor EnvC (AmiA/AmiB activator)
MAKCKLKNHTNRNQDNSPSEEPSAPTSASPGYSTMPRKQDSELKSYLMMLVEDIKKGFNNSLIEIQENTDKELEVLKESQENKTKQVMELNKTIQDLKREVEKIKKKQSDTILDRNPRKEIWNHRCEHQQQNKRDGRVNLRCRRFHREHGHNNQRKCKMQKDPNSTYPGNPGHNEKTKPMDNRSR